MSTKPEPYKEGYMECVDQLAALRAENERLRAEWREKDHAWIVRAEEYGAEIERLQAEIERLRAQVAAHHTPGFVCEA